MLRQKRMKSKIHCAVGHKIHQQFLTKVDRHTAQVYRNQDNTDGVRL